MDASTFLIAVAQIIMIDILLGGDNAVVIALACRRLPEAQRAKGIFWGVVGAIAVRIVLIFFALQLLALPWLKLLGAALLVWIGIKLLLPEDDDAHEGMAASDNLWGAVRTVIVADVVMSLDNVIAVAGAAHGNMELVVFGILVSVPIIVWGSRFVLKLMDRFPAVITLGGALLGWIAGEVLATDPGYAAKLTALTPHAKTILEIGCAVLVVAVGYFLQQRAKKKHQEHDPVDLAADKGKE